MALKFDLIRAGDVLYDRRRLQGRLCEWVVVVKEVDATGRRALVSWNGNPPRWSTERGVCLYHRRSMYAKKGPV